MVVVVFRTLLWLVLVSLHVFCAAFYGANAYIYDRFGSTQLSIQMASFQLTIGTRSFPMITAFYGVFAVCHSVFLLDMVVRSIINRKLVFHRSQKIKRPNTQLNKLHGDACSRLWMSAWIRLKSGFKAGSSTKLQSVVSRASSFWDSIDHIAVADVKEKYFSRLFLLREALECVLQSIQAYRMSRNVPRVWFNRFGVVTVAINCWSTPVLQRFIERNSRLELILCLLFGLLLDAITSIGVTVVLAAQYLPDYNVSETNFDTEKCWSNSIWYSFMLTEFHLLFVQSWSDFLTRMLFALTMLMSMEEVKMHAAAAANNNIQPATSQKTKSRLWSKRIESCVHVAMVAWGFIIVGLHIDASIGSTVPDCTVLLHPWLTSKPACSYLEINCMKQNPPIRGSEAELNAIWNSIEPQMLVVLEFISCEDLHIPHSFQSFHGLSAFNMMGNVISSWEQDAALTHTHHPQMHHLGLLYNNLSAYGNGSSLPPGLTNPDFPRHLLDIFITCGLADLPANLDTIWPKSGMNLFLVGNAFIKVPDVLLRMDLSHLTIDQNQIQNLPAELFELKSLRWLSVLGNPIISFPRDLEPSASLSIFNFALTNVTWLPDWMASAAFLHQVVMSGSQTPLCLDDSASGASLRSHLNCQAPPILILDQIKDKRG